MEKLRVIGNEEGKIIVANESGESFSLPVDDVLRAELRRVQKTRDASNRISRTSPREIQAQIRSGLTAAEVAAVLDIDIEDVIRYERPVLAEREFIVGQALAVPVLLGSEIDHDSPATFGSAVRAKLAEAGATSERWTSWKDSTGWTVKLEFVAGDVERDARWSFEPRRSSLAPLNSDATQLSRQGAIPEGLIPRLRALDVPGAKDDSRFDSAAFGPRKSMSVVAEQSEAPESDGDVDHDTSAASAPQTSTSPTAAQDAAIKRAPDSPQPSGETADLLEALRRRRGQREPLPGMAESGRSPSHPDAAAPVALFDALEPGYEDDDAQRMSSSSEADAEGARSGPESARRKGRASLPSWDEIVFGARSDD